jgi:hypothetical protein
MDILKDLCLDNLKFLYDKTIYYKKEFDLSDLLKSIKKYEITIDWNELLDF